MSEPKLISPMLDGFIMGDAISEHHGVRCCPAMVKETGSKYIVKILSVPASQVQLEALLLSGAFANEEAALAYFKDQAQEVIDEVHILQKLSTLEGFVPYESCKIVPMDNEVGFDVYLLGTYKRSLESFMRKHAMTHLAAVNLGLDMCASLAVARQAGYLYVDLKPENIYITADHDYKIGDLGFIKLNSLKYASLPEKYRSKYTAPEIKDAYAQLNTTIDTYAAGMILYQAYNGGILPEIVPGEKLVAPAFADYEMAEIILKACHPDPSERWQDPVQMGQELVAYMQRNGANDDPIIPPVVIPPETPVVVDDTAEAEDENQNEEAQDNNDQAPESEEQITIDAILEESQVDESDATEEAEAEAEDAGCDSEAADEETAEAEDEIQDDTLPSEEIVGEISYEELSDDVEEILTLADDLIEHEAPSPAVAPDPIEIPMPEPIVLADSDEEDSTEEASEEDATGEEEVVLEEDEDDEEYDEDEYEEYDEESGGKIGKKILVAFLILILLAGLAFGGYFFYKNYYLQNVDAFSVQGDGDKLYVNVDASIDDSLLTVYCTDTHGTKLEKQVVNGQVLFDNLKPNMHYTVEVVASGFRKLTGTTTDTYSTPAQTTVLNFKALTGSLDGSVILSYNIDGNDSSGWTVTCTADGEETQVAEFTDHMVYIAGLTSGKEYTFTLDAADPLYLAGETQIRHVVSAPVFAENLTVTDYKDASLTIVWNSPEAATSENWSVRCYNDNGYDSALMVSETTATFEGIDPSSPYTIEVIAEGMSAGVHTQITANAVALTNAQATAAADASGITVTWEAPSVDCKWNVVFTLLGTDKSEAVRTSKKSVTLSPVIPGASYSIAIELEDGTTVFGGILSADVPEATRFNGKKLGLLASNVDMDFNMCHRPNKSDWNRKDVKKADYTDTFVVGDEAAFVVYVPSKYSTAKVYIGILYLIKDESGNMVSYSSTTRTWRDMWNSRYCELNIPELPDAPGNYTMEVYFNGGAVHSQSFTMTAE